MATVCHSVSQFGVGGQQSRGTEAFLALPIWGFCPSKVLGGFPPTLFLASFLSREKKTRNYSQGSLSGKNNPVVKSSVPRAERPGFKSWHEATRC